MAVFTSVENMIINGIDMAATFNKDGGYFVIQNVSGRTMDNIEVMRTRIAGRRGSIYRGHDVGERILSVDIALKAKSYPDLRKRLEELNKMLLSFETNTIQFIDELDRTYYGTVESLAEAEENSRIYKGTITIVCTDPLKYAKAITKPFVGGQVSVVNNGAVAADPVYKFDVNADITYLDIFTGEDYMRIGRPNADGLAPIDPTTTIVSNVTSSMTGWTPATKTEFARVMGDMESNGTSIKPNAFGSLASGWHGPAYEYGIPSQMQDFEIVAALNLLNTQASRLGKVTLELLDANGTTVARMAMYKNNKGSRGNEGNIRVGTISDHKQLILASGDKGYEWNNFRGIMKVSRQGNKWTGHVAMINPVTGVHHSRMTGTFIDTTGKFAAPVTKVRLHFGRLGTQPVLEMYFSSLTIRRLNAVDVDRVPVIAKAGDEIVFDHENSVVYINGEPRNDLKDFGAAYFRIPKGVTTVLYEPNDKVSGNINYREGYL